MKKLLLLFLVGCLNALLPPIVCSQNLYNKKNVDRTAMSFFDGMQTFRALEYTVAPDLQSEKVYRLQTEPENGFPGMELTGIDGDDGVFFEDKMPYDNMFTDNPTPFLSGEAVQLFNGFQKVMKAFDQRFGWKGIDGTGSTAIELLIHNSDKSPIFTGSSAYYQKIEKYFAFGRSIQNSTPLWCHTDVIAHEFTHAIINHKSTIGTSDNPCPEFSSINEGLADVFGIYIKNKILQSTPQNYNWLIGESAIGTPVDLRDPKSYNSADTYKGQNFSNVCDSQYKIAGGTGIVGKWFYLLSSGFAGTAVNDLGYQYGNITGIGTEKAIQIIWDALPELKAYSTYPALRTITLKAAQQLYGVNSAEYVATQQAWTAVGVGENNLPFFSIYPANATTKIEPWPGVKVNFSWDNDPRVKEVEVQMSPNYDFSGNSQIYKVNKFDILFKPGGGATYVGSATGYFHPGETVYVRAKITQADALFCKGLNPLCQVFQKFSPTNAFTLDEKKTEFWHGVPTAGFVANAWNDPQIEWKPVPDANEYTFQIANDKTFFNLVYSGTVKYTGHYPESGTITPTLEAGKYYYVRVRAERINLVNNLGAWSKTDSLKAYIPPTSILQALNQNPNDPPTNVSSLGFAVNYYTAPGAFQYKVQVATDDAFASIVRSQVVPGNLTSALVTLPELPDGTSLYVRVLPQKGVVYSTCTNVWRVKTDKNAALLAMAGPDVKVPIPYKTYLGKIFKWTLNAVDIGLVNHFEVHIKEKSSNLTSIFQTPGKALEREVLDQLMYDDHQGIEVRVLAVGPTGAKSGLSLPFTYTICPDQPFPKFPTDMDKVDPSKAFTMTWDPSLWFQQGNQYLVTLASNGIPIAGFNNAATSTTSMVVPAGTLGNGKNYTLTIQNSASCPGVDAFTVLFSTIAGGNNIPPDPPKKDLDIKLQAFRSDLDLSDPVPFENSDYVLEVELVDPNGDPMQIVDGNGNPVSQLLVDSENSILGMNAVNVPTGKYTLKIKMFKIFDPVLYSLYDQPKFSVILNGKTVIDDHFISIYPFDVNSPYNEWRDDFQFSDVILNHE